MLAEIFLLKLEFLRQQQAANRASPSRPRFVPFTLSVGLRPAPMRA